MCIIPDIPHRLNTVFYPVYGALLSYFPAEMLAIRTRLWYNYMNTKWVRRVY